MDPGKRKLKQNEDFYEFGGPVGTFLYILIVPITFIGINLVCNSKECSFYNIPTLNKIWRQKYFDLTVFVLYLTFVFSLWVLSSLPFGGKRVKSPFNEFVTMNAFSNFCVLLMFGAVLEFCGFKIVDYILDRLMQFVVASLIFGTVLSLYAFCRSFYVSKDRLNKSNVGMPIVYEFFMGREIMPLVGNVSVKFYLMKLFGISAVLLDLAFLYKHLQMVQSGETDFNFTLLTVIILEMIYYGDPLYVEDVWMNSFEMTEEGCGYMSCNGYPGAGIFVVSPAKYLYEHNVRRSFGANIFTLLLFIVGYLMFRIGNSQKDEFKNNQNKYKEPQIFKASKGKTFLTSGLWGYSRHPNIFGDILLQTALGILVLNVPAGIVMMSTVYFLIHRTFRLEKKCFQKYGSDWNAYKERIKYMLVPFVY